MQGMMMIIIMIIMITIIITSALLQRQHRPLKRITPPSCCTPSFRLLVCASLLGSIAWSA